ncbi:DnaT-like ssDNA-binding protein [Chromobacterium violaceum]|uniref:DnaT-like ssDNA-binding protein n=1 Tax=Chromobacterium violaceum TaxID=536 RepID=UPI0009D97455|nr:DnaT-like ssDNA-binding protein [Chromobacterium violaceum]OQS10069.1 hypothetical protein B0T38_10890 [Chromobacterium violaceum]OQS26484.1 hypothetical protein B0T37_10495 [Chromobacterium violaceum]QRO33968.1 hypothetical protein I6K04_04285 [Chromobacterium violaceum]QRQ16229.1 hypothetical protein I6K03_18445 [Chromobacterium violaceum]
MALIVENGTGQPDAQSYISVTEADDYHAAIGNAGWSGDEVAKSAALRRAVQYLDGRYRFAGCRLTATQVLEWPRQPLGVPKALKDAQAELALRALKGELFADSDGRVLVSKTIGPIKKEYAQAGGSRFPVVDALLRPLLAGGGQVRLRRG